MSLFLGYIHYMMYDKIMFQENILEDLLNLLDEDEKNSLKKELDAKFLIEKGDLKDIIDESNIHGWLDERVKRSENRLAKTVLYLLKDFTIKDLEDKFYEIGKSYEAGNSPSQVFNFISSKFLDGMPCDHALMILKNEDDEVIFNIARDVHKEIWEKYLDPTIYWNLRDSFIAGSLEKSNLKYKKIDENYVIGKWYSGFFKKYHRLFRRRAQRNY